jgi:ABC-type transporter Mla subunit MlaD
MYLLTRYICSQVDDDKIIIPRNSVVEVNQSGLLMETLIDITPKDPLLAPSVGPLDPDCYKEGSILCDRQRMKGQQGVSLDALVGIFTRLGGDVEEIGVNKSYKLAEKVASIMEEAQPLLTQVHQQDSNSLLLLLLLLLLFWLKSALVIRISVSTIIFFIL